jgi:accessory gene regulator protein AgrB
MKQFLLKKIVVRKMFTGATLFVVCFIYFLCNAFVLGAEISWLIISMFVFGLPLLILYAPIWSFISEIIGEKHAKKQIDKKVLSLIIHLIGGGISPFIIVGVTKPSELITGFDSSVLFLSLTGSVIAFIFWLVDLLILEKISK